jgi:hypothetical protein
VHICALCRARLTAAALRLYITSVTEAPSRVPATRTKQRDGRPIRAPGRPPPPCRGGHVPLTDCCRLGASNCGTDDTRCRHMLPHLPHLPHGCTVGVALLLDNSKLDSGARTPPPRAAVTCLSRTAVVWAHLTAGRTTHDVATCYPIYPIYPIYPMDVRWGLLFCSITRNSIPSLATGRVETGCGPRGRLMRCCHAPDQRPHGYSVCHRPGRHVLQLELSRAF